MFWVILAWVIAFLIHWTVLYCVSVNDFGTKEEDYDRSSTEEKGVSGFNSKT